MSEEEKKAIEFLEDIKNSCWTTKYIMSSDCKNCEFLLNLIEKQQKEIEELREYKLNSIPLYKIREKLDDLDLSEELQDKYDELYGSEAVSKAYKEILKENKR